MKFKINKDMQKARLERHLNEVVKAAESAAWHGRTRFFYPISRADRRDIPGQFTRKVEAHTDGQVTCIRGGNRDNGIEFAIKPNKE